MISNLKFWLEGSASGQISKLDGAGDAALYRKDNIQPVYYIWKGDMCILITSDYGEAYDVWEDVKKIEEVQ